MEKASAVVVVNRDFQRAQKAMILRGELDFARGFEIAPGLVGLFHFRKFGLFAFFIFIPAVETDSCFQHQEDIVSGSLDFPDRFRDAVRLGKGIVNGVSQFLHEPL